MDPMLERMDQELRLRRLSPLTRRSYRDKIRQFSRFLNKPIAEAIGEDVRRYMLWLVDEEKVTPPTQKMTLAALRFLFINTLFKPEAVEKIPWPKIPVRYRRILEPSEVAAILDHTFDSRYRMALIVAYATGLRLSEIVCLQRKDIDRGASAIHVRHGKGNRHRVARLSKELRRVLDSYLQIHQPRRPWIFPNRRGLGCIKARSLQRCIKISVERAGLGRGISMTTFRRTFATHMVDSGVNPRLVQFMLGHSALSSTFRYIDVSAKSLIHLPSLLAELPPGPQLGLVFGASRAGGLDESDSSCPLDSDVAPIEQIEQQDLFLLPKTQSVPVDAGEQIATPQAVLFA